MITEFDNQKRAQLSAIVVTAIATMQEDLERMQGFESRHYSDNERAETREDIAIAEALLNDLKQIPAPTEEDENRLQIIRALAEDQHGTASREGELEIDADALVSEGDDPGAYVQAWVWVDFAGTELNS